MRVIEDRTPIDELLEEQQRLFTPVTRFSDFKNGSYTPDLESVYRDLIPLSKPGFGEQYAFEVDLDACTGCKACVTSCHNMNGLEEHETWRDVGLIHSRDGQPYQQTITSACHHCVDPACMHGCPVLAYEKDETTGIVKHLDDQCIGCQYCVLKCPYNVPKYSEMLGIVRKCDLCHVRLQASEAPACVQACPTSAIRITTVETSGARETAAKGDFLPGAPDPEYTVPTTRYVTKKVVPESAIAADSADLVPQHAHLPLVFMLVFTQTALGCFLFSLVGGEKSLVVGGFSALIVGIVTSVLHLGRPLGAWRSFLGLRRSWLSREIVVFGALLPLGGVYLVATQYPSIEGLTFSGPVTAGLAGAGVFCSVMIYADTRRPFWAIGWGSIRFYGTVVVMGSASWLMTNVSTVPLVVLIIVCSIKLGLEFFQLSFLVRVGGEDRIAKSKRLMRGPLIKNTRLRFLCGLGGGMLLPGLMLVNLGDSESIFVLAFLCWSLLFAGELFERTLFFQAVVAPKMPGGVTG